MKYFGLLIYLLTTFLCNGQTAPRIKTEGHSIEDFVPKDWRMIATTRGDLNKDGIDDAALVIQEMDAEKIVINDGMGVDTLDTNPRILIILFNDPVSNKFKLKETSNTFILSHDSPTMDDPFSGIVISKGIVQIEFRFWFSAGSWYQTLLEYKFRYQKNDLFLIGAEFDETHRGTMENVQRSFNFSTKKMSETRTTIEKDKDGEEVEKSKTEWKNLEIKELKTLRTLTTPLQWTVAPGVDI